MSALAWVVICLCSMAACYQLGVEEERERNKKRNRWKDKE